ncbi:DNA/RNA non-specific endonuclease [Microcoleus sp. ARI1-B5]|uniref:DNA/RNA non-specific endonuclease n=1 Tax=Microcoleus sp. ARI1-A3 TaxID=2818558 RepID=UPI002FD6DB8B
MSNSGAVTKDLGQFKTIPPGSNSPFSSVSVLTHGFTLLPGQGGIPDSFYEVADSIAKTGNDGLILRYEKPTGSWIPIDKNGGVLTTLTGGLQPTDTNYFRTLTSNIKANYVNQNKSLVLLPEWSLDRESVIPDVGFSEGAADALFASMVQLDLALGGGVGEYQGNQLKRLYDSQGKLIRQQGDLFNSPLHFMGFSRGTVVNSEIVQRLGTFFPQAGGTSMANRDLQMTTIDPHDFYQPSLNLQLAGFISTNFSDFYEPKVQVWNNVTFADNYYQTVANPNHGTATPNGRALGQLPQEELNKNPKPAGLNFPKASGVNLGKADREILLGTREGEPDRINSRIGFTKDDDIGGTHKRAWTWYAGTVDLDLEQVQTQYPHASNPNVPELINDQLGERDANQWFDPNFPAARPWYDNASGEGIGEGWFYSVLGGGKEQRQYSPTGRVPVSFDNTLSAGMRGDYAVPTLFNGNFDQYIPNRSGAEEFGRNAISQEIPGWSFHNSATSKLADPTKHLVNWSTIDGLRQRSLNGTNEIPGTSYLERMGIDRDDPKFSNYALELKGGDSITHNRFVVPDWGSLRFNIHVPKKAADRGNKLKVTLTDAASGEEITETILLNEANFLTGISDSFYNNDLEKDAARKLGYATRGFETFNVFDTFYEGSTQQKELDKFRGKTATLKFELEGNDVVYLDDVFFKSSSLRFGEPTPKDGRSPARYSGAAYDGNLYKDNLLLEKPQYTLSYNGTGNIPNWASFQINKSWIFLDGEKNLSKRGFTNDRSLPPDFYQVTNNDYKKRKPYVGGHQTPLASRSITLKDSKAVNLLTNIVPQHEDHNRSIFWEKFENYGQDFAKEGKEVYVINGIDGIKGSLDAGGKAIQIPENIWKVMVVLDKPGADPSATPVYAVGFYYPNENPGNIAEGWRNKDWSKIDDLTQRPVWSLEEIETKIGYDLFPLLPQEIKQDIKDIKYIFPSKESIGDTWASLPWKSNPPPLPEDPTDPEEELEELEGESEELEEE